MSNLALLFSLAALGAAVQPAALCSPEQQAGYLLNQAIDREALESPQRLRVWDRMTESWTLMQEGQRPDPRARLLILNFWADYCKPCKDEFPWLKLMAQRIEEDYGGQVRFAFISETASVDKMKAFVKANASHLPDLLYQDTNEALAESLRRAVPGGEISLPVTLILDGNRIVRYALVGAMVHRTSELRAAIATLARVERIERIAPAPARTR
jgi:thiol-disulfide isomerase/thioredoxin